MNDATIYACTAVSANFGATDKKPTPTVQIVVRVDEGPMKGKFVTYEEQVDARSAKYVGWSATAVGWKGGDIETIKADATKWIAETGGVTTVEIKEIVTRKGTPDEGIWFKPSAIGKGAAKPLRKADSNATRDANDAMRAAMGGPPADDVPHASTGYDPDFDGLAVTTREPSSIAKVLS